MQQTGETRDAIIDDNNRLLEDILNANQHRKDKYWIAIFAKPSRSNVDGKYTLMQHIKPYSYKPESKVGLIVAEVDNEKGTMKWEINMPDVPFEYDAIPGVKSISGGEVIVETSTIPNAYIQ